MPSTINGSRRISKLELLKERHRKRKRKETNVERIMPLVRTAFTKKQMTTQLGSTVTAAVTNNLDMVILNGIQSGTGPTFRTGQRVHIQSVRVRHVLDFRQRSNQDFVHGNYCRQMVVVVAKPRSASPSASVMPNYNDFFGNSLHDGSQISTIVSSVKPDQHGEVTIVREWQNIARQWALPNGTAAAIRSCSDVQFVDVFVPLDIVVTFNGSANPMTIGQIAENMLLLVSRAQLSSENNNVQIVNPGIAVVTYTDV